MKNCCTFAVHWILKWFWKNVCVLNMEYLCECVKDTKMIYLGMFDIYRHRKYDFVAQVNNTKWQCQWYANTCTNHCLETWIYCVLCVENAFSPYVLLILWNGNLYLCFLIQLDFSIFVCLLFLLKFFTSKFIVEIEIDEIHWN